MKASRRNGFTLIEMLVVMGIISILSGALLLGYGRVTRAAQRAKAQETVANVATALGILLQQKGSWPSGLSRYGSQAGGDGRGCVKEVAKIFADNKLLGVKLDSGDKPIGIDRCGIVDPWAVAVLKRSPNVSGDAAVPTGGTVADHVIYFALDTDFDGITEVANTGGARSGTVKVRANAVAWCAGADGQMGTTKTNADNIYSWQRKQEVNE